MMIKEVAHVLHADWNGKNVIFTGVSTDSRTLKQGDLFIALTGENFFGSKFVGNAAEKGAVAAMIEQTVEHHDIPVDIPLIRVKDTRLGLGQLAAHWRNRFMLPLIGVTGSNGKTTVKEMMDHWILFWPLKAISTTISACLKCCCGYANIIAMRSLKWA